MSRELQKADEATARVIPMTEGRVPAELRWMETPREKLISTLQSSLYTGAKRESVEMVLEYCATAGLNVMLKPVHIVPMNVKTGYNKWEWRDVIMPGINHYRTQASRSGSYMGKSEPEWGPDVQRKWNNIEITVPAWCRITVKRLIGTHVAEFTATEFWDENYATAGRDKSWPNAMWTKRPRGQLAKCTEAQALRMAFPEFASDATAEEMEGKVIDLTVDAVVDRPKAAIGSLDKFAGVDTRGEPEPESETVEDAEVEDVAPAETPTMPVKALKAYIEGSEWGPGWQWLVDIMPTATPEQRQELADRHAEILWAVYNSDAKEQGPNSRAAVKLSMDLGYHVPPLDKRARGAGKAGA